MSIASQVYSDARDSHVLCHQVALSMWTGVATSPGIQAQSYAHVCSSLHVVRDPVRACSPRISFNESNPPMQGCEVAVWHSLAAGPSTAALRNDFLVLIRS